MGRGRKTGSDNLAQKFNQCVMFSGLLFLLSGTFFNWYDGVILGSVLIVVIMIIGPILYYFSDLL